jgi:hypothetical protein
MSDNQKPTDDEIRESMMDGFASTFGVRCDPADAMQMILDRARRELASTLCSSCARKKRFKIRLGEEMMSYASNLMKDPPRTRWQRFRSYAWQAWMFVRVGAALLLFRLFTRCTCKPDETEKVN